MTGIFIEDSADGFTLAANEKVELTAYAQFKAAAPVKVDATFSIPSEASAIAKIENGNILVGLSAGTTQVDAVYLTASASASVTVTSV